MSYTERGDNERKNQRALFSYYLPQTNRIANERKNNSLESRKVDDSRVTKRVVQYIDDPDKKSALEEVKRLSMRSKKSSAKKEKEDELDNKETNRLMFKEDNEKDEENNGKPFMNRKKGKFFKKEKPGIFKKIRPNISKNKRVHFGEKPSKTIETINTDINRSEDNDNDEENGFENNNDNNDVYNNNESNTYDDYEARKNKIIDNNIFKSRNMNNTYNNNSYVNNYAVKFNTYDNNETPYQNKNTVIENHHNKDKIIVNEYHTKDNNKPSKNYKTEYVWDKNINRLVEKRIYLDDNNKEIQNTNDMNIYGNEQLDNDEENNKKVEDRKGGIKVNLKKNFRFMKKDDEKNESKENKENKEEHENEEENTPKKKGGKVLEYKFEQIKKEKLDPEILGGKDKRKIEIRKRYGDCQVIFKKEQKLLKKKENNNPPKEKDKEIIIEKEYNPSKKKDKEIIIEKEYNPSKKNEKEIIIEKELHLPKKKNKEPIKEKGDNSPREKYKEIIIEKEYNPSKKKDKEIIIEKGDNSPREKYKEIIIEKEYNPSKKKDKEIIIEKEYNPSKKKEKEIIIEKENKKEIKKIIEVPIDKPKELNKTNDSIRFYRRGIVIHNPNDKEEKPKKEKEIKKEVKTDNPSKKPNHNYSEIIIEKKTIVDDGREVNPKIEVDTFQYKLGDNVYKKRKFINKNDEYNYMPKLPKISFEEKRYKKRPSYQPVDTGSNLLIYTRKKIDEKNNEENKYNFKKKNIRIKMTDEKFGDDEEMIKNTPFQKYNNYSKNSFGKVFIESTNFERRIFDSSGDLGKYRKKEFIPSYDNINEVYDDDMDERNYTNEKKYQIKYKEYKKEKPRNKIKILIEDEGNYENDN